MMTAAIKDQILKDLLDQMQPYIDVDIEQLSRKHATTPFMLMLAIEQFHDMRLIRLETTKSSVGVYIKMAAADFMRKGGFVVAEEIVNASLEKLQLEIESLQKTDPEKANTFL